MQQGICYIHIGTHKTGTTAIQAMLGLNDVAFLARDIYIPRTGRYHIAYAGQHNIAWELTGHPSFVPATGTLAQLVVELRMNQHASACISAEDLEFLYARPDRIQTLANAIASSGYDSRIVVYLRPQAPYLRSFHAELAKSDPTITLAECLNSLIRTGGIERGIRAEFDYERLLDPFAAVFGDERIIVRPHVNSGEANRLLFDFIDVINPPGRHDKMSLVLPDGPVNASPPQFAGEQLDDVALARLEGRFGPGNAAVARRFGVHIAVV
jgi:hypothetical protein